MDQNLRSLMLLRLAFSPKVDQDYPKLVALWTFAFTKAIGRIDQRLDEHRINKAFGDSTHKLTTWPSPAQIIELMPRRPEVKQVHHDPRHTEDAGSTLAQMTRALCDLSEGIITKDQFDEMMKGWES